ncbi:hypothetical protein EGY25_01570 [Brevundimonas intermedia]|uniref:MFS transporter n=1 Tax=Brevundimonas intermedia TaxID=74315 RepID=A0A4Y9S5N4_9CAUL|nr:hypothetical protein [Brevundimonas intermedia]TFW15309.1 hypothetical protein EGY25_01570 [Brevundimonas intermedia]
MRFWLLMLGGLLIWAAHFMGLYLLSSASDVARDDAGAWNGAGLVFSMICLIAIAGLCWRCIVWLRMKPTDETRAFGLRLAVAGGLLGGIGVVFQTLVLVAPV